MIPAQAGAGYLNPAPAPALQVSGGAHPRHALIPVPPPSAAPGLKDRMDAPAAARAVPPRSSPRRPAGSGISAPRGPAPARQSRTARARPAPPCPLTTPRARNDVPVMPASRENDPGAAPPPGTVRAGTGMWSRDGQHHVPPQLPRCRRRAHRVSRGPPAARVRAVSRYQQLQQASTQLRSDNRQATPRPRPRRRRHPAAHPGHQRLRQQLDDGMKVTRIAAAPTRG